MLTEVLATVSFLAAITPAVAPDLAYWTYLPGFDAVSSVAGPEGSQYFLSDSTVPCGTSPSFAQFQPTVAVFVGKLVSNGRNVEWTFCRPGAGGALTADRAGNIYVATSSATGSTVTKLAPGGVRPLLEWTILAAQVTAMTVDSTGNVYAIGSASSGFSTTAGAHRSDCPAVVCGFAVKLGRTGTTAFATYMPIGGYAIAVDGRGQAWIAGTSMLAFGPAGSNRYYSLGYVQKLDAEGKTLLFSQSFGGGSSTAQSFNGGARGIAIDAEDSAYVAGYASVNAPTTPGTLQPSKPFPSTSAPYLVKFNSTGTIEYGTFLNSFGGRADAVSVDSAGNAYVAVASPGWPATAPRLNCGWDTPTGLLILDRTGSSILSSRYISGWVRSLTRLESGAVFVSGATSASAFRTTPEAYIADYPWGQTLTAFAASVDFSRPAGPTLTCVANAASGWAGRNAFGPTGAVAPGEIVSIFGEHFAAGSDARVSFDGVPAPILYSGANRINAVVPFAAGAKSKVTELFVHLGARRIGPYRLPVSAAVPGVFQSGTPGAEAVALNQDGTVNSSATPALFGSALTIFMTGAGLYDGNLTDGSTGPMTQPFPAPLLGVRASISKFGSPPIEAEVLFTGQAPGLIAGVVQVNLRLPAGLTAGSNFLYIRCGDFPAPAVQFFVSGQ